MTMTLTNNKMSELGLSALREVGNIGAGNAVSALATMVDRTVEMSVPQVGIMPLRDFTAMAGGEEAPSVGVYMPVEGDAPGHVAFLWPYESATRLADHVLGREIGETKVLEDLELSALNEIGNILASSYLVAICEMTGLNLLSCPPTIACDMTSAILESIVTAFSDLEDQALTIRTHIDETRAAVEGYFLFIPDPGSLQTILRALQIEC